MENLKRILAILFLSVILLSCKDNKDEVMDQSFGGYVATSVNIRIKDSDGNDRLAPTGHNPLTSFKVYYLVNGQKVLYNNPNMSAPGAYSIKKDDVGNYYYVQVLLNSPSPGDDSQNDWITYLEYQDGSTDTIKATFSVEPGFIAINKAWYNGTLQWDRISTGSLEVFELTKP